ncbi:MAG: TetR/AcrR family transcriptional regulator C-terminal domain-containing protein [Propionibacteriaceae bacterium]|nr:TetR/AcrR family transcriptional regulator C-terminal domain-containing protein [Propionibacteriaceae bacterium]
MSSERVSLSRSSIASAAIEVLDEKGLDGLTMRAVAGKLGAGTMSLYRHVDNRDELLDLVVTTLTNRIELDPPTGDWRVDLARVACRMKEALVLRPQLTMLLTTRARATASSLRALNTTLGILRSAGMSAREAVRTNHALGNLVAGAALWEAETQRADRTHDNSPQPELENIVWAGAELYAGTTQERFEHGLHLLLDGIQTRLHDR